MIAVVDVGNSNVVVAVFDGDVLLKKARTASDLKKSSDDFADEFAGFFKNCSCEAAIVSSVVPSLTDVVCSAVERVLSVAPMVFSSSVFDKLPISLSDEMKAEVGNDILSNAVEAFSRYGASIVVDFGTALTFSAISSQGIFAGVSIAPGLETAIKSLFEKTAQIPKISLDVPEDSLGNTTATAVQSGIIFGYCGLVESLVARMKSDLRRKLNESERIFVVGTGGLCGVLQPLMKAFDKVDDDLTLCGIRRVAAILTGKSLR